MVPYFTGEWHQQTARRSDGQAIDAQIFLCSAGPSVSFVRLWSVCACKTALYSIMQRTNLGKGFARPGRRSGQPQFSSVSPVSSVSLLLLLLPPQLACQLTDQHDSLLGYPGCLSFLDVASGQRDCPSIHLQSFPFLCPIHDTTFCVCLFIRHKEWRG